MKHWRATLIGPTSTIREAVETLDRAAMQVAVVVDEEGRLRGVVTDGDVRRGMLKGLKLDEPVAAVMNARPTCASPSETRETLLALMQSKKVHQIPVVDDEGRLVGLEVMDEILSVQPRPNTVLLMAGGLGTRLRPLTENRPKPLLKVGDKPILETILEKCKGYGLTRFAISVNYKAEMIEEYFGDGRERGVQITYLREPERRGTAGALALLDPRPRDPIVVMNGDLITDLNLSHLLDFHHRQGSTATMCVREHEFTVPYGVVELDGHRILSLHEKPKQNFFVNAGVYVIDPSVIDRVPSSYCDMTDIFEDLIDAGEDTAVFPVREYWLDIGRPEDYERANRQGEDAGSA